METKQLEKLNYVAIGMLDDFSVRIGRVIRVKQSEIAVFRTTDDTLYALENKSPHRKGGSLVEGMISEHYLYDPLYDWKISLESGLVQAPDTGQVQTYPTRMIGNEVLIGLPVEE